MSLPGSLHLTRSFAALGLLLTCSTGQAGGQMGAAEPCAASPPYATKGDASVKRRVDAAREQHATLRRILHERVPSAGTMILVMLVSAHHSTTQLSYVATRDEKGTWTVSRVGLTTFEFARTAADREPQSLEVLSRSAGIALDRLLADPCLYSQPPVTAGEAAGPVGDWQTSLAVVTPERMYAATALGRLPAVGGRIVSAVTGW